MRRPHTCFSEKPQQHLILPHRRLLLVRPPLLLVLLLLLTLTVSSWLAVFLCGFSKPRRQQVPSLEFNESLNKNNAHHSSAESVQDRNDSLCSGNLLGSPYHNWKLFASDFQEMLHKLKIFVYPDASMNQSSSPFARVFLPNPNPFHPKLANYFSEHMFKVALLRSSLLTPHPQDAHFFFLPFSVNTLRNDPRMHSEASISDFVTQYTTRISWEYKFWNASRGTDHFYICCHSVGREAASKHHDLHNNAIQVTCSSSYFQRLYISHKDVGLPQVWPRPPEKLLNPPELRHKLVFFAGRVQNSHIRQELMAVWGNDTDMDLFSGSSPFPYEEGLRKSKYCLHVKGYEVNTARVCDAIHYGCIPVIVSNYYDLPFSNVLDWSKFSVIISHKSIATLKKILLSISKQKYLSMYQNLCLVRRHFAWHTTPRGYDSFHMTAYQLWLRRGVHRLSY